MPRFQLPRPSKLRGFRPRKSRTRGSAIDTSRSVNSHIRAPRRVTERPTGISSRSLNAAIDLRARRMLGFWPAIVASCSSAASSILESCLASPTPMFSVTLTRRGICIGFS